MELHKVENYRSLKFIPVLRKETKSLITSTMFDAFIILSTVGLSIIMLQR